MRNLRQQEIHHLTKVDRGRQDLNPDNWLHPESVHHALCCFVRYKVRCTCEGLHTLPLHSSHLFTPHYSHGQQGSPIHADSSTNRQASSHWHIHTHEQLPVPRCYTIPVVENFIPFNAHIKSLLYRGYFCLTTYHRERKNEPKRGEGIIQHQTAGWQ